MMHSEEVQRLYRRVHIADRVHITGSGDGFRDRGDEMNMD
jgi:hypothetical protein